MSAMRKKRILVYLLVFALSGFSHSAHAQFEDLIENTLNTQQSNVDTVASDIFANTLANSLSAEQIEELTAQALLSAGLSAEEVEANADAARATAATGPQSRIDVDAVLQDYESSRELLDRYSSMRSEFYVSQEDVPLPLYDLQNLPKENILSDESEGLPFDIRREAIKEAAISYGARGGLAWRTFEITQQLEKRSRYLDRVFDFRQLLIPAPSGFMIEPPIISESVNSMLIQTGGQEAAVSDRIYNIINNAQIVSAPRGWRSYLERTWPSVEPPPDILRPETEEERRVWVELVTVGWQEGVKQANEIFGEDLSGLLADFRGMVRYRMLLAQGMISAPYALQVDRGVTGGGSEMRIGDRAVQITGVPKLISGANRWKPASR